MISIVTPVSYAEVLPISVDIDISGISTINDISVSRRNQLVSDLRSDVIEFMEDIGLRKHWVVSSGAAESTMTLSLLQRAPNDQLVLKLVFVGDTRSQVLTYFEMRSVPGQTLYPDHLRGMVHRALMAQYVNVFNASATVHAETDDALKTLVHIRRPLLDEQRILYLENKIEFKWDRAPVFQTQESVGKNRFVLKVGVRPGEVRRGAVRPKFYQSVLGVERPKALVCLQRSKVPDPADSTVPRVELECPVDGACGFSGADPENWANPACDPTGSRQATWSWPSLLSVAHASEQAASWAVPSLETLHARVESESDAFVGFTEFVIQADNLIGIDADGYTVKISANGVPIRIDGAPSEMQVFPLIPTRGLLYRFGLENVNFAGRDDGCEHLTATITFIKNGLETGQRIWLRRRYAALRDAPERVSDPGNGIFYWGGRYVQPVREPDRGVFVASRLYDLDDETQRLSVLAALNSLRKEIDDQGWYVSADVIGSGLGLRSAAMGDGKLRIVGKVRPPRQVRADGRAAYGVLVGVEEPSGQLQFSFDRRQLENLQHVLAGLRRESIRAQALIPEIPYLYTYSKERQSGPAWVCSDG